MARITTDNISELRKWMLIYNFPASAELPQDDFQNSVIYQISNILRDNKGELTDFELYPVVPPVNIEDPIILTSLIATISYKELTNGKWYAYVPYW